jgi:transketolase
MINPNLFSKNKTETKSPRDGYGQGLLEVGRKIPEVVVFTADLSESTRAIYFAKEFPQRFFECGVAEQGMVTAASGIASYGKIPFACSFSAFSPGRTWEQIRTTIALNDVPVVIAGLFVGVSVGPDGATHQMLEDISLMRSMPNMIVLAPADYNASVKIVEIAARSGKPVYLRVPRVELPEIYTTGAEFKIGGSNVVWEDNKSEVVILSHGTMLYESLVAAKLLNKKSKAVTVIDCYSIKPLDESVILEHCQNAGCVVVAEEHQLSGGLGSAVSELFSQNTPLPVEYVSVEDSFGQSGQPQELLSHYGLTAENIYKKAVRVINRKKALLLK